MDLEYSDESSNPEEIKKYGKRLEIKSKRLEKEAKADSDKWGRRRADYYQDEDDDDSDLESQEQEVMELIAKRNQGVSNKNFEAFNESSSEEMASEMDSDSASEDKDDGRSEQMDLQNELIIKDLKFYETRLVKVFEPLVNSNQTKAQVSKLGFQFIKNYAEFMRLYVSKLHFYLVLACENKSLLSHPILREIAMTKAKIGLFDRIYFKFKKVLLDLVKKAKISNVIKLKKGEQDERGVKAQKKMGHQQIFSEESEETDEEEEEEESVSEEDGESSQNEGSEDEEEMTLEKKLKSYEEKAKKNKQNIQKSKHAQAQSKDGNTTTNGNSKSIENRKKHQNHKPKDSFINLGLKKSILKPNKLKNAEFDFQDGSSDDEDILKLTQGLQKQPDVFKDFKKKNDDFSIDVNALKKMMSQGGGGFDDFGGDFDTGMDLEEPKPKSKQPEEGKKKLKINKEALKMYEDLKGKIEIENEKRKQLKKLKLKTEEQDEYDKMYAITKVRGDESRLITGDMDKNLGLRRKRDKITGRKKLQKKFKQAQQKVRSMGRYVAEYSGRYDGEERGVRQTIVKDIDLTK